MRVFLQEKNRALARLQRDHAASHGKRKGRWLDAWSATATRRDWFARYGRLVGATRATGFLFFEDESEFASIVRPLEDRYGRPLTGHGRLKCQRAFKENPDSFRRLAERALQQAHRNPVGLLIKMVQDGEHRFWNVGSVEADRRADDEPGFPKAGA